MSWFGGAEASPAQAASAAAYNTNTPEPTGSGMPAASLFDQYASPTSAGRSRRGHSPTRTSRLRTTGVKLACYLNTECDHGRSTIIHLPEECDTLGEVLPKIQMAMQLDKKMMYAAELFLPSGEKVTSYTQLIDAAEMQTAIIVGCGEPFDPSTIPFDILEFYLQGGGREAPKKVKSELAAKRKAFARERADTVRSSGHGVYPNSAAVVTARSQTVETNRESASHMRHEYMEQLMYRASQQQELVSRVQQNNAMHKLEHKESKERRKQYEAQRLAKIEEEKRVQKDILKAKTEKRHKMIKDRHDKVKADYESGAGKMVQKRALLRAQKAAGSKEVTL